MDIEIIKYLFLNIYRQCILLRNMGESSRCLELEQQIRYADIFCGLGAFHTAFDIVDREKYKCVYACDIDKNVRELYELNHGIRPDGDIYNVVIEEIPDFKILCAGFPCQPYSIAGKKMGFSDSRGGKLFCRLLEVIDVKQPEILFFENVKNLLSIHSGHIIQTIEEELKKRGYHVSYKVLNSKHYNSPQSRERIYIICKKDCPFQFKEVKNDIVPVSSIIDHDVKQFFDYQQKYKLEECTNKRSMMKYKLINIQTNRGGRQGERVYKIDTCGPTICSTSGGPGANTGLYEIDGKIRTLTIHETLKMFGFDHYDFGSLSNKKILCYLGNTIVVNVLVELIRQISKEES